MKKLLTALMMVLTVALMTSGAFACDKCTNDVENCKCKCHQTCDKDCDCGCHKGEKCTCKDCKCAECNCTEDVENCDCQCHKKCDCEKCGENCKCDDNCSCKSKEKTKKFLFFSKKIKCNCEQ